MFEDVPAGSLLAFAIALVPAALTWWWGRALVRLADDPALAERLLANRRRTGPAAVFTAAMLVVGWPSSAWWTLPLMIVARGAATYPLRKALYGETWSIARYLWFWTRLIFGVYGFWVALPSLPFLAEGAGSFDWIVATAIAAPLAVLTTRQGRVIRVVLGARTLDDPSLLARFAPMVEACKLRKVAFERVDLHGGAISNALALPSTTDPAVLFTDTLLAHLDPDEVTAICAHELAHLEHFNEARLRLLNRITYGLIALAWMASPLARFAGVTWSGLPFLTVTAGLVLVLGWRARDRQRNETASDLRAVELSGHPEALVTALTKGYTFNRIPRRVAPQAERHATHPSLARRIRAIRVAGGLTPAPLGDAASFAATKGLAAVTFQADRLQWAEGDAAVHSLNYAYLSEMRLKAPPSGPPTLVIVERSGRRWELPLAASDAARAQAVLDVVDGRLAEPAPAPRVWPRVVRALAGFGVVSAMMAGQFAVALAALIAVAQPESPLLAGAGVAAVTASAVLFRDRASGIVAGVAAVLAMAGALLLVAAWANRRDELTKRTPAAIAILGALAALGVAAVVVGGLAPVDLYQSSRSFPGAAVLLFATAGALAGWRVPATRPAAVVLACAATALAATGSTTFLNLFGRDPFLVRADAFAIRTVNARPSTEFTVPFVISELRLSPSGGHVAVTSYQDTDDDEVAPAAFRVGPAGGSLTRLAAQDVTFVDEDHLLALVKLNAEDAVVRLFALGATPSLAWEQRVHELQGAHLTFKPRTRTWRVMGWDRGLNLVRIEGTIGTPGADEMKWPSQDARGGWAESMTSSGNDALVVRTQFDIGMLGRGGFLRWGWLLMPQPQMHIVTLGPARTTVAVSRLGAQCAAVALDDERLICTMFDGSVTRVAALDPTGRVTPIGSLPGRFVGYERTGAGWLTGWADTSPIAVRIATKEAVRIKSVPGSPVVRLAAADGVVATIGYIRGGATVRVYPVTN
jgi:Zn-dependent protease with chaperone function